MANVKAKFRFSKENGQKCARAHKINVFEHIYTLVFSIFVSMNKNHTIKDIAKLAGVSKGTVDRVLHKRGKVSEEALEKVTKVLEEIEYQPNLMARNLKNNKIYSICVLMPDPTIDPYWSSCVEGINDAIQEMKNFRVSVEIFYFDPETPRSFLQANEKILDSLPNAVLMVPLFYKETISIAKKYDASKIPVAAFNNQIKSNTMKSFVGQDLVQSGRVAAKLMTSILSKGDIVIIHINEAYKNAVHMQEKEKGFREYFKELKNPDYEIFTCKLKHSNYKDSLSRFLKEHPNTSGVFVTTSKAYQVAGTIKSESAVKPVIIGYDLLDENLFYLNNGMIDFLIHQNQKRQAYLGITTLIDHFIFEKEIPDELLLPIDIVNSENAKYYLV